MAIKVYKPNTAGRRKMSVTDYSILTTRKPEKSLVRILKQSKGRDKTGQISVRHMGGGFKRKFRVISSLSDHLNEKCKVLSLEYDPNRSAFISLVLYESGAKAYILAWDKIKVDDEVIASDKAEIKLGNRMRLKNIPTGTMIFDIEIQPGQHGKIAKSAGSCAMLLAKDKGQVILKMPSGETRKILDQCFASIGQMSNTTHSSVVIGKAGRKRLMGIRPTVRGKAMHPAAHPHGGGEGVNPIGLKYPKTPWGKHALGTRTRKKKKYSDSLIITRRKK